MDTFASSKRNFSECSVADIENCSKNSAAIANPQPAAKRAKTSMQPNEVDSKELMGIDGFFDDDEDNFGFVMDLLKDAEQFTLDLSEWKRCKVESILRENRSHSIVVADKRSEAKAKCVLEPPWSSLPIKEGDIVSVKAVLDRPTNTFRVTSQDGMIVTEPDFLVSGTSVVGALYCQRRGVLQERFRGIDADSSIMTIGTIVHELFQKSLRAGLTKIEDIAATGRQMLESKKLSHMLYASKLSKADASKELAQFYPKIYEFVKNNVSLNQPPKHCQSEVQISAIKDIEESIWCPQLGLKGKIDVTVEAKLKTDPTLRLMPLELKTGRASFSAEHKGQIVLYEMMMNLVGHRVDSGILLYLREGKCAPVASNRNMKRDLIMLRNEVAHFLSKGISDVDENTAELGNIVQLPEPINNQHVCSRCPYSIICTAFTKRENLELPEGHAIKLIAENSLAHLSDRHIDYFIRWSGLIFLENEEARNSFKQKHLWTKSADERQKMGRAVTNLELFGHVSKAGEEFFHTFKLKPNLQDADTVLSQLHAQNTLSSFFEINDYLICSTNTRTAVAAGRVVGIAKDELTMSLERDLSQLYPKQRFQLDKYESNSHAIFNLTNVGALLDDTERAAVLRRIIIDKEKPAFSRTIPSSFTVAAKQILNELNKHQKIAVLTAIGTKSYCLFKGLPGTGKTQTVIALIRLLAAMDKTILITSNTHSAVDNVLKRLRPYGLKFLRLGAQSRVDPELRDFTEDVAIEKCSTPADLAAAYDSFKIVGVTCLGAAHSMLAQRTFDFCIVDEATQVLQTAVIRPLLYSDKFILIGDPDQLPPVVKSKKAKKLGADESLFFRLDELQSCCVLPTQYRMNKTITKLANELSYGGKLMCANEKVANSSLKLPDAPTIQRKHKLEKWLLRTTASQLDLSVVLINTLNTYKSSMTFASTRNGGHSLEQPVALYQNYCEVAVVFYTIMALLECGLECSSVGIIAPFRAQVELFKFYRQLLHKFYKLQHNKLEDDVLNIEINTVDQYQGKDKDVIFYSCTKSVNPDLAESRPSSSSTSEYEILEDQRRLTVAITRAKQKLIIVGDTKSLERYTPFQKLFKSISNAGKITLQDHMFGFEWSGIFNTLDSLQDCE